MRLPSLIILAALSLATEASAEVWRSREGTCADWRAVWNVNQGQDGLWVGEVTHEHVGGPCAALTIQVVQSTVRAAIVGANFFAVRQGGDQAVVCTYYGLIDRGRVRGLELCENQATRLEFNLRLPRGDNEGRSGSDRSGTE